VTIDETSTGPVGLRAGGRVSIIKTVFCPQCGSEASGNNCWKCGAALAKPAPSEGASGAGAQDVDDWENEVRYEVLIQRPEVREMLARQAAAAPKRASAEDFLAGADKWLKPQVPLGIIAEIVQPLYARLGVGTGKSRREHVALPPGRVLVNVMATLARHGYHPKTVQQAHDGCTIEAILPSDIWSFEGSLLVTVQRAAEGSEVEAAAAIKGQLFDWGKSRAILDEFFNELTKQPA
jgi:hypothetical protein